MYVATVYTCSIDSRRHMYAYSLPRGQDFFPIQTRKPVGYKRKAVSSHDSSQFTLWCHTSQYSSVTASQLVTTDISILK